MTDRGADDDALRAECAALRGERARLEARIAALEAQLASSRDEADRSHRLVVNITDNAPSVIYVKDLAGRFLLSNKLHTEFLGRTPGEVLGRQEGDFLSPDEAAEIAAVTERVVATRAIEVHEFRLTLDGTPHWFLEQVFPLVDDRGEPFAVGGISTDVTRRKLAEDEATLFRVLIERSPDPVCVAPYPLDLDAPLTYANAAATAAFGDESQVRAWLAERLSARAQARVEAALAGGQVWRAEWTRDDPSGEARSFDVSVFVVEKGGDERALAWMLRDVSEARRHTQERERLQESVINAQERVLAELSAP
ncbi:MAG: PAS domain-containing protein [Nannocystaceae bacterium]